MARMATDDLDKFLNKHKVSRAELARRLGLSTKSAVTHWFTRESIPRHQQLNLKRVLDDIIKKRN